MNDETLFERLGVTYEEVDGILYPLISFVPEEEQIVGVGKYGGLWITYLKEFYPVRYRSLVRFAELHDRALQVNETAYELLEDIEEGWLKRHKPRNANSFMEQLHLRNLARMIAEEMVLQDVVRRFH